MISYVKLLFVLLLLGGCSAVGGPDPFEGMNRKPMAFNDGADRLILKPIARGYVAITPDPIERSVHNFFSNLGEPITIVNQFLQAKFLLGLQDSARFITNSVIGIGGFLDVATSLGLVEHDEDFGQTFGRWGIPGGAFLMVPFWGPVTVRDGVGDIVGVFFYPPTYLKPRSSRRQVFAVWAIDKRAQLLKTEKLIDGDRYIFIRDAYLQNRQYLIDDGKIVSDPFLDEMQ